MISVIMPAFNSDKYISEAIQSILSQTYDNFEFIIINDGSTDKTEAIILSFDDIRIRYYSNESNKGLIFTLNRGLELSTREFIARMDSDDIACPQRLEQQLNFLQNNSTYGVCGSFIKLINEKGLIGRTVALPIEDEEIKAYMYFSSPLAHPTILSRATILKENMYSFDYKAAEDYELWVRISPKTKFYNLPQVLLQYRVHNESITTMSKSQADISFGEALKAIISPKLVDKSLVNTYIDFVLKNDEVSIQVYVAWLAKFIKEPMLEGNYVKKYFIKRWFGLCLAKTNYRYLLANSLSFTMPIQYYCMMFDNVIRHIYTKIGHV